MKMSQLVDKLKLSGLVEEVRQLKTYVYVPKIQRDKEIVISGRSPDSLMKLLEELKNNPPEGVRFIEDSMSWECNLVNPRITWQQEEL